MAAMVLQLFRLLARANGAQPASDWAFAAFFVRLNTPRHDELGIGVVKPASS